MSPARKMLYAAVSLAILVGLIYIGIGIFNRAKKTAEIVEDSQMTTNKVTSEYGITKYDGLEIMGSTVITYIKQVLEEYDVTIEVEADKSFTLTKADANSSTYANFRKFNSADNNMYINPMKKYTVSVKRNKNDVITNIIIKVITE